MEQSIVVEKLNEAKERGYFRTADLFAGCGGMSLGFHRAGFRCICAIEIDEDARASHETNFRRFAEGKYRSYSDITKTSPEVAIPYPSDRGAGIDNAIDVIIGGPPCQAFSRLGRAALWDINGKKNAHGEDERATMYQYFLEYIARSRPVAFVMENVREIGKFVGRNIAEEISLAAEDIGYCVRYTLLNSVWFGVPQLRERVFIIGISNELGRVPIFPKIQCEYTLPVGYSTSRAGTGHIEFLRPYDHYVDHLEFSNNIKPAVTTEQAFADLPPIYYHLDGRKGKGVPRKTDFEMKYTSDYSINSFIESMRTWPDFEAHPHIFTGHIIRFTPRDYETFRKMPHGGMYPEALETAQNIFKERLLEAEKIAGKNIKEGSVEWNELHKAIIPPYLVSRYPNKFRKMWPNHPARTLPAHIGKDSYSHIHYDSEQARGISLREAARIQSFPDGFKFIGSMNSTLRQIGNAVPPLMAYNVALCLSQVLLTQNPQTIKTEIVKQKKISEFKQINNEEGL